MSCILHTWLLDYKTCDVYNDPAGHKADCMSTCVLLIRPSYNVCDASVC